MKKYVRFNINGNYLNLLDGRIQYSKNDISHATVILSDDDINIDYIYQLNEKVDKNLYYDWDFFYKYTDKELDGADLFRIKILNTIDTCGEECGTKYDESISCPICGAGRKQVGLLKLSSNLSFAGYDIYKTIGGEIIVTKRFQELLLKNNIQGIIFQPIIINGEISPYFMQLIATVSIDISHKTRFGIDYFDKMNIPSSNEKTINICGHNITIPKEIYVCPNHDLLGLCLLSELFIDKESFRLHHYDFMKTMQYVGVKRGMLRPEPLYVCSKSFFEMIKRENIYGMEFDIAHIK